MKTGFSVASAAIVFAVAVGFAPAAMAQQNPSAASGKAGVCASCHGINGVSSNPLYPNLAGQHLEYLLKSLTAYRDGERQDPIMSPMAQGLNDEDIAELSRYFADQ